MCVHICVVDARVVERKLSERKTGKESGQPGVDFLGNVVLARRLCGVPAAGV